MLQSASKHIARVLIVAGSDSGGGAGIQADLKTVTALGAYGMTAVTAVTAQNTLGVHGVVAIPADFVRRQMAVCLADIGCDAAKTGMLVNAAVIAAVAAAIKQHAVTRLVVDPVLNASSGTPLLKADAIAALKHELFPLATVVTPNLSEAQALTGTNVETIGQMHEAARRLHRLGARHVVITGGHLAGEAVDVLFDGNAVHELRAARIAQPHNHGTGCIFASAIAACLAQNKSVYDSVRIAKDLVANALRGALPLGKGTGPADPSALSGRKPAPS